MKENKKQNVSPEDFVTIWERCGSLEEVAKELTKKTGKTYTRAMASSRACEYRHSGVQLKTMDAGRTRIRADFLNSLIQKIRDPQSRMQAAAQS